MIKTDFFLQRILPLLKLSLLLMLQLHLQLHTRKMYVKDLEILQAKNIYVLRFVFFI